jgi:hypothetical protein
VTRHWLSAATLALLLAAGPGLAAEKRPAASFGVIEAPTPAAVRGQAADWLKSVGKASEQSKFDAIWKDEQRTPLDRLADTFALGSADAAKLLADAADPLTPAPTRVPDVLKNDKLPAFFRANLALAYARALSNRRVHEEALTALKLYGPDQVVDPASYLFHRAVSEHALLHKAEANRSIRRLLEEAAAASPERYKTVALLMQLDMAAWKDKDLGDIARKMKVVEDRLDLARGGPKTQEKQKEIIARLDEMIKKLENQAKKPGGT